MVDKLRSRARIETAELPHVTSTDDPPDLDPKDRFERRDRATKHRARVRRASGLAGFMQAAASLVGRRTPVIAAIVLASLVPPALGPSLADTAQPPARKTEILGPLVPAASRSRAEGVVSRTVPIDDSDPYARHVIAVHDAIEDAGQVARADGVPIWVSADDLESGEAMVRTIAGNRIGLAPGAHVHLDVESATLDGDHRSLRSDVDAALTRLGEGTDLTDELVRDLSSLLVYDAAARVERIRERSVKNTTNVAVLSVQQSPMDVAERLLVGLQAAPEGTPAHAALLALGDDPLGAIARRVVKTLDREVGSRAMWPATRTLRRQLEEARDAGVLVFGSSGDRRRPDDPKSWSTPFADGLEHLLTVGAAKADGRMRTESSFGGVDLAAPGEALPVGSDSDPYDGSDVAAAYGAATAALMLGNRANASPDEIEHLLTDPAARRGIDDTGRDGLGLIDVAAAVDIAAKATNASFPTSRERYRAIQALKSGPDIDADHPYLAHVAHLRSELESNGLPTRGDGVTAYVIEGRWSDHNGSVLRTVADEAFGIAPGADVHLVTESPWYNNRERTLSRRVSAAKNDILAGDVPTDRLIVDIAEKTVLSRAADVRGISERVDGTSTVFVNMSFGTTSSSIASTLVDHLADAPKGSAAARYFSELGATNRERRHEMIRRISTILGEPAAQRRIDQARSQLADEIRKARNNRVITYTSAGNARDEVPEENRGYSTHIADGIPGLIVVGATEYNDPLDVHDDRMTDFSSEGQITFCAPGAKIPVKRDGRDGRGTSYAAPYGMGVGILMVAANPDLTPDEIEAIHRAVAQDIPTELDGDGVMDVVQAVDRARSVRR